jgi:hypothetical protein
MRKLTYSTAEQYHGWLESKNKPLTPFDLGVFIEWLKNKKIPSLENYRDLHNYAPTVAGVSTPTSSGPPRRVSNTNASQPLQGRNGNGLPSSGNGGSNGGGTRATAVGHHLTSNVPQCDGNDSLLFGDDTIESADVNIESEWNGFNLRMGPRIAEKDPCPPSLCNGEKHLIIDCPKIAKMTPAQRWNAVVKTEKRCRKCLRAVHPKGKCQGRPCKKCQGEHHQIFCGAKPEDALKARVNAGRMTSEPDESPEEEKGSYFLDVYSEFFDDASATQPAADQQDGAWAGVSPPVGGELHDGMPTQGPTAHLNTMRIGSSHIEDDVRQDLASLNEAEFTSFTSPQARH